MRLIDADKLVKYLADWQLTEAPFAEYEIYAAYDVIEQCINAVNEQPTVETNKWIPCSERLPEHNTDVLFYVHNDGCYVGWYDEDGNRWCSNGLDGCAVANQWVKVVAWMLLPEPYEEEE